MKVWMFSILFLCGNALGAESMPPRDASRGELLYSTHCLACHSAQVHWRDKRLAKDRAGVQAQVRRWTGVVKAGWSDQDINEVARYLNERYYRYPD